MGYETTFRGRTVRCDSLDDLRRLIEADDRDRAGQHLAAGGLAHALAGLKSASPARVSQILTANHEIQSGLDRAIQVLSILRDADGPDGIASADLTERLGLASARGLAPISGAIRRALEASPFEDEDALRFVRHDGERYWKPGPKIEMAIEWLENEAAELQGGSK